MIKLTMRGLFLASFPREPIKEILIHFRDDFGEEFSLIRGRGSECRSRVGAGVLPMARKAFDIL